MKHACILCMHTMLACISCSNEFYVFLFVWERQIQWGTQVTMRVVFLLVPDNGVHRPEAGKSQSAATFGKKRKILANVPNAMSSVQEAIPENSEDLFLTSLGKGAQTATSAIQAKRGATCPLSEQLSASQARLERAQKLKDVAADLVLSAVQAVLRARKEEKNAGDALVAIEGRLDNAIQRASMHKACCHSTCYWRLWNDMQTSCRSTLLSWWHS